MQTAKRRIKQLVGATGNQRAIAACFTFSDASIGYTKAFEYRVKQNAQLASAAEKLRLAFTIHEDCSIDFQQVLTNEAMLHRAQLALISAQQ